VTGVAGERWKNEIEEKVQALAGGLKELVYAPGGSFLGIYGGEKELVFLELRQESGKWKTGRRAEEKWQRPMDLKEMASLLAERTAMRLKREGWENLPLAVCLHEGECICKVFPMSAEIPPAEQKEAAFWEIDNYLQSCGLNLETVSCTSVRLPGEDMAVEAVILLKEKIRLLEEAFAARGYELAGLYPETPLLAECQPWGKGWQVGKVQIAGGENAEGRDSLEGERRAIYAAVALAGLGSPGWPDSLLAREKQASPWNYDGIGRLAAALVGLLLSVSLCLDLGELYFTSGEAEEARAQLAELEPARQVMAQDRKLAAAAEQKEACLGRLTEKSRPLDSLLVHLGTVTVEGAWLTEVDCTEEKALHIRGEAVDYSALGEFLGAFEQDRDFFTSVPVLEESRQQEGRVEFRLKMEMGL